MKRSLILALAGLALAAPRALAGPGEVTAVSVLPGAGRVSVVIDVRGSVSVQDFTLENPARLVIDVLGATLDAPGLGYDGRNRGGILNIRSSQYRPDVVRIVLELEQLRDYELEYADGAIRVAFGTDRTFSAWTSMAPSEYAAALEAAVAPRAPTNRFQGSQQSVVTASYDSASIGEVMATFAALSGKSIVLSSGATSGGGQGLWITAEVRNQPWDVAFQAILESNGLTAVEDPIGVIRVQTQRELFSRDSLRQVAEPLVTQVVPVDYARAASLQPIIQNILESGGESARRGSVIADTGTNSLIITDVASRIESTVSRVRDLDQQTPQVSIQAKLILVNRTGIEQLGLQYDLGSQKAFFNTLLSRPDPSTAEAVDLNGDGVPDGFGATESFDPTATPSVVRLGGNALAAVANADATILGSALSLIFSTAIGNFQLSSFLEASEEVRLSDLQAEPLITTADNTPARIQVGEDTPIRILEPGAQQQGAQVTTEFRETGIILSVTPHVTNNRKILLDISAENSALQAAASDLGFTFVKQFAQNTLLVDDGETAVIGGLTVSQVSVSKSGIPFLVDLPVIGGLFGFTQRQETRQDLLILVTPHIIDFPDRQGVGR